MSCPSAVSCRDRCLFEPLAVDEYDPLRDGRVERADPPRIEDHHGVGDGVHHAHSRRKACVPCRLQGELRFGIGVRVTFPCEIESAPLRPRLGTLPRPVQFLAWPASLIPPRAIPSSATRRAFRRRPRSSTIWSLVMRSCQGPRGTRAPCTGRIYLEIRRLIQRPYPTGPISTCALLKSGSSMLPPCRHRHPGGRAFIFTS